MCYNNDKILLIMTTRKIKFSEGEYYHIYNRGVDKRSIFNDSNDYNKFIESLYCANSTEPIGKNKGFPMIIKGETLTYIGAWCLMPNHFHLLVKEKSEGGLSKFLSKLQTSYSMYFNSKYKRNGSLFQGMFKAEHLDEDGYLKYIYSYIHLNPVKLIQSDWKEKGLDDIEKTKEFLNNYKYSSHCDYLNLNRRETKILNKKVFPEYFESVDIFTDEIFSWLKFSK